MPADAPAAPGWNIARLIAAAALLAAGLFATRGAWEDILGIAQRDEEMSHIWLVPFLSLWLVWVRRRQLLATRPSSGGIFGPALIAIGWAISHWGFYGARQSPWHFGALLVCIGCIATAIGGRAMLAVWPAVLVLAFVIPVPGMVRQRISIPLEQITARLAAAILSFAGAPVGRTGNQILINGYPVTVAEACNGLRMVFPLFLVVYLFCFMLPLRAWVRWVLLLTSPLCAIVCNVLRLLPTVLLYGYASKTTADNFHDYSGWPMVTIAFFALMLIIMVLRKFGVPVMTPLAQSRAATSPGNSGLGTARLRGVAMIAPVASVLLLVGIAAADKLRIDPHEADAFHAKAVQAIAAMPRILGAGRAQWFTIGKDIPLPDDAKGLLKPNGYAHRVYMNGLTGRRVTMLLVQCRDTRDMQGHYPPICYPSAGCRIDGGSPQTWQTANGMSIDGTEYTITRPSGEQTIIRDFFVLPSGKIVRDMESVNAAAKDYRELVFGVAQIQILFDASVGGAERDQIFAELIGPSRDTIEALRSGFATAAVAVAQADGGHGGMK
jgi:exosortase